MTTFFVISSKVLTSLPHTRSWPLRLATLGSQEEGAFTLGCAMAKGSIHLIRL